MRRISRIQPSSADGSRRAKKRWIPILLAMAVATQAGGAHGAAATLVEVDKLPLRTSGRWIVDQAGKTVRFIPSLFPPAPPCHNITNHLLEYHNSEEEKTHHALPTAPSHSLLADPPIRCIHRAPTHGRRRDLKQNLPPPTFHLNQARGSSGRA